MADEAIKTGDGGRVDTTLDYQARERKRRPRGVVALALGGGGVLLSPIQIGALLGLAAVVSGFVALSRIRRDPLRNGGMGYAWLGISLGVAAIPLAAIFTPCMCRSHEMANRGTCSANLRGIVQSMAVYASENGDVFPAVPFAPYGAANGGTSAAQGSSDAAAAMAAMQAPGGPVAGSPLAGPWILVLSDYVSPKQFICKSDPAAPMPASRTDTAENFYLQFQKDDQISYSFAYPYTPDGKVGDWWKESEDPTLPIASDMAPAPGTGKPKRNLAAVGKRNSANHDGDGQNVAFDDNHVEFERDAAVGQRGDNIFTLSGNPAGGSATGVAPTVSPIHVGGSPGNFDTVMVPERDLDSGKLW